MILFSRYIGNFFTLPTFHFSEVLDKGVLQYHHRNIGYM